MLWRILKAPFVLPFWLAAQAWARLTQGKLNKRGLP